MSRHKKREGLEGRSDEYWKKKVQALFEEKKKGLERLSKKHAECVELMKGNQILTTLVLEQADVIDSLKLKLQRAQAIMSGDRKEVVLSSSLKRRRSNQRESSSFKTLLKESALIGPFLRARKDVSLSKLSRGMHNSLSG